jgi:uncharacterized membrane protein YjgN (DUF898 family)
MTGPPEQTSQAITVAPAPAPRAVSVGDSTAQLVAPFEFTGTAREYFGIWVFNTLLTIATLGVYSAWAKVRSQRYFHRCTSVLGASFDYHANPWRILEGRLLVSALLLTLALLQFYQLSLIIPATVLYFLVRPWVMVRSLEFRARNTSYRQLHLEFQGSVREAYAIRLKGAALTLVTCGLLYPRSRVQLVDFMTAGHRFGDQRFHWSAETDDYYAAYLGAAALAVAGGGALWALKSLSDGALLIPRFWGLSIYLYLLVPAAYLQARLTNLRVGKLLLGRHRFRCQISPRRLVLLYVTNFLACSASLGLLIPWAKVRTTRYVLSCMALLPSGAFEIQGGTVASDAHAVGDAAGDQGLDLGLGL